MYNFDKEMQRNIVHVIDSENYTHYLKQKTRIP